MSFFLRIPKISPMYIRFCRHSQLCSIPSIQASGTRRRAPTENLTAHLQVNLPFFVSHDCKLSRFKAVHLNSKHLSRGASGTCGKKCPPSIRFFRPTNKILITAQLFELFDPDRFSSTKNNFRVRGYCFPIQVDDSKLTFKRVVPNFADKLAKMGRRVLHTRVSDTDH
eukprot:Gregarina_sp_Poly_1__989@NODE_1240_length_4670_cov_15_237237_g845_i0_p1_GENE_NODE_1240_length_4670_cov_15_237237_g845_i0NODE_1240_length_4670_cov_15_237237_g845_i0_p1_ORF_typecomplete_len168_score7_56_NODE_1240_length_4670_cov_15_237237_g845_i07321235